MFIIHVSTFNSFINFLFFTIKVGIFHYNNSSKKNPNGQSFHSFYSPTLEEENATNVISSTTILTILFTLEKN